MVEKQVEEKEEVEKRDRRNTLKIESTREKWNTREMNRRKARKEEKEKGGRRR